MFPYNILSSLGFAVVSIWVLVESYGFPKNDMSTVHPGSWPSFLGWVLLILSMLLFAETLVKRRIAKRQEAAGEAYQADEPAPFNFRSKGIIYVYVLCGIFAVFSLVMHFVNFTVATLILIPSCMYLLGEKRPWMLAVVTVAMPIVVHVIFVRILGIQLP